MRIPEGKHITAFDTYTLYSDISKVIKKHALTFSTLHISEIDRSFTTYAGFIFMLSEKKIYIGVSILKIYIYLFVYIIEYSEYIIIFINTIIF